MFLRLRKISGARTASWHALALAFGIFMFLGQTYVALAILGIALVLTGSRIFILFAKERKHIETISRRNIRRVVGRTIPRKIRALRRRIKLIATRYHRRIRRNLLPHRITYAGVITLVLWATIPTSLVLAVSSALMLAVLPVSLYSLQKAADRARAQGVLAALIPEAYANTSPPEPFRPAPRLGPGAGKRIPINPSKKLDVPATAIIRILGNDLPPRHKEGQTLANLDFLLRNEPHYPRSERIVILNRVVDPERRTVLRQMAEKATFGVHEIAFDPDEFAAQPLDFDCLPFPGFLDSEVFKLLPRSLQLSALNAVFRFKNCYAINNNGARNTAIELGLEKSEWALPFDGNVFLPANGWRSFAAAILNHRDRRYWVLPMRRVSSNHDIYSSRKVLQTWEEPQLAFSRSSSERFREDLPYGRRPKVDLLWKLGVPGPWEELSQLPWDQPYPDKSKDFGLYGFAGEVFRLSSGKSGLESGRSRTKVASMRNQARDEARLAYLLSLERIFPTKDDSIKQLVKIAEFALAPTK